MKYQLKVIIASTRQGRKGPLIAHWFLDILKQHSDFKIEVLDLKEVNLPFLDEPEHPRLQNYKHEHTKKWSKIIDSADAFIFITPEYNFGYPATLKNALDFLFKEWQEKPVGFVSYGGVSGGTRAVQSIKHTVTTLGMVPVMQAVNIPFFTQFINKDGVFEGNDNLGKSAGSMLKQLLRWTKALKEMREKSE